MKKICLFAIAALLLVVLASCAEPVTPVGYTRYDKSGEEYVFYDSLMYLDQIKVYRNKAAFDSEDLYDMTFDFGRCLGRDELDDVSYTLVDMSTTPIYMSLLVYKDSPLYGESKKVYLNGKALVPSDTDDEGSFVRYNFDSIDLNRTNPKGHIDKSAVNSLEYK